MSTTSLVMLCVVESTAGVVLVAVGAVRQRRLARASLRPRLLQFWGAALFVEGACQYLFFALLGGRDRSVVWLVGGVAFIAVPISVYQRTRAIRREFAEGPAPPD